MILKGGYHLLELINEVLDLARIESGRLLLAVESVGLGPVMEEAVSLVAPLAEQRGITFVDRGACRGRCVLADRARLKQVLLNLLSNAVKTTARAVRLRSTASKQWRVGCA